jgi:hypothetical protein
MQSFKSKYVRLAGIVASVAVVAAFAGWGGPPISRGRF